MAAKSVRSIEQIKGEKIMKLFCLLIYLFLASVRLTWAEPLAEASNWCAEVQQSLVDQTGKPLECTTVEAEKKKYRCVIMNNY